MEFRDNLSSHPEPKSKTRNFLQRTKSDGNLGSGNDYPPIKMLRSQSDINTSTFNKKDKLHVDLYLMEEYLEAKYENQRKELETKYHNITGNLVERITTGKVVDSTVARGISEKIYKEFDNELEKLEKSKKEEKERLQQQYAIKLNEDKSFRSKLESSWQEVWNKIKK